MWTIREQITMEKEVCERVLDTYTRKYTQLLEETEDRALTWSESETKSFMERRMQVLFESFMRAHERLQALPSVTHDLTAS